MTLKKSSQFFIPLNIEKLNKLSNTNSPIYAIMIIIFKDYEFSHESIFQTINIEKYMISTVQHQNALRQIYYEHHAKERKV